MSHNSNTEYNVIGIMSGSSLDGLDIACCRFKKESDWKFEIISATTLEFPKKWLEALKTAHDLNAYELNKLDIDLGFFIGESINNYIRFSGFKPDFISSHGHTIFHRPEENVTVQIGNGSSITAITGLPVVFDFRSLDVCCGGQGAPLVPVGDRMLFSEYDYCLNLGGIANYSFEEKGLRRAYDICPVNQLLNYLAEKENKRFDNEGLIARSGTISNDLLESLNSIGFYKAPLPKSLGNEYIRQYFIPIIESKELSIADKLRTVTEHIAQKISEVLTIKGGKILVTGGGAYNKFLTERINDISDATIIIPDNTLINFKEALIFAFLGVLRVRNEVNCLKSVTGATKDSCTGKITGKIEL